jgi:hypothetical protein
VQSFPVIAENPAHRVASGQSHADTEPPFGAGGTWINQIMSVAIVHARVFSSTGGDYTESVAGSNAANR